MPAMLILDRRLSFMPLDDLEKHWESVAWLLSAKRDPVSGKLPDYYQRLYVQCVAEFERRGVQLALF